MLKSRYLIITFICSFVIRPAYAIDPTAPYYEQIIQGLTEQATRDRVIPWQPAVGDKHELMSNREALIPPQCYTKNEGRHNPCYVCHQDQNPLQPGTSTHVYDDVENSMNDRDLQEAYSFSDVGLTNHWTNLFEDRSARVAAISDATILDWIDDDNYSALAGRLQAANYGDDTYYDFSAPGGFGTPWMPDLADLQEGAAAFDQYGLALDNSWWVAFNYKPLPSTFWPHNGSTDDVMIRLPPEFWKLSNGQDSVDLYRANLALVEANIKRMTTISSLPIDETAIGIDVNNDGLFQPNVTEVHVETNQMNFNGSTYNYYLGEAGDNAVEDAKWTMRPTIYPVGTEFLHSVRYVGVDEEGNISNARRMKELRYMRRIRASSHGQLWSKYTEEQFEKEQGDLPLFSDHQHNGLEKGGFGWDVVGFIEDWEGKLRLNTWEENAFCMGCHSTIGSTIDKTFSFPRKLDGAAGWGYINLRGMPDVPNIGETTPEVETYMGRVGGGSEFRSNPELEAKFYLADGETVNRVALASAKDVYDLITPSPERALMMNKAYKVITEDQDYIYGRDATVTPPPRVFESVTNDTSTLQPEHQYDWDIRLDWSQAPDEGECMYAGDVAFADLSGGHLMTIGGISDEQHDQVCTEGSVVMAGMLTVQLASGYTPQAGDRYEIIRADSLSGSFSSVVLPTLSGLTFSTEQVGDSFYIVANSSTGGSDTIDEDIPIPFAWLLIQFLAMMATGYWFVQKRR